MKAHLPYIQKYPRVTPEPGIAETAVAIGVILALISMGYGLASYALAIISGLLFGGCAA